MATLLPPSFLDQIDGFAALPGIGRKSAQRLAFHVLSLPDGEAEALAASILEARKKVHACPVCQNLTDGELCPICESERRHEFQGVYHVLHGVLSPMNRVGPDDIRIRSLVERVGAGGVSEVIMATNPDTEGDTTAMYISRLLKPFGVKVTRLAYGIPVGSNLEFADDATLLRAMEGRREM